MDDQLTFNDQTKPAVPSTLNVLTILTFIGSGLSILFSVIYPFLMKFLKGFMDKAATSGQELTAKQLEDMEKGRKAMELAEANMIPIVIVGLIGAVLCIVGAVMMRKLKKDGLWIYTAGELLPVIVSFLLMGTQQFTGVMSIILSAVIPLVFVGLYFSQKKELVK